MASWRRHRRPESARLGSGQADWRSVAGRLRRAVDCPTSIASASIIGLERALLGGAWRGSRPTSISGNSRTAVTFAHVPSPHQRSYHRQCPRVRTQSPGDSPGLLGLDARRVDRPQMVDVDLMSHHPSLPTTVTRPHFSLAMRSVFFQRRSGSAGAAASPNFSPRVDPARDGCRGGGKSAVRW